MDCVSRELGFEQISDGADHLRGDLVERLVLMMRGCVRVYVVLSTYLDTTVIDFHQEAVDATGLVVTARVTALDNDLLRVQ